MPKFHTSWTVLRHGPVEQLEQNLLRVEGWLPRMPLRRVMTVARRSDGKLVIHNPIALADAEMAEIEAFGDVAYLVVPNAYHRLDVAAFKQRYPTAQVACPKAARKRVEEAVSVDLEFAAMDDDDVSLRELAGTGDREGVMVIRHGQTATLVLNDAVFNMPHEAGFQGFVLKHVTKSTGGPRVSRIFRTFVIADKLAFFADLARLAETPGLRRIIVSHHETIDDAPADTLRRLVDAG